MMLSLLIRWAYVHCYILLKCLGILYHLLHLLKGFLPSVRFHWFLILLFLIYLFARLFVNDIVKLVIEFAAEFATLNYFIIIEAVIITYCIVCGVK